MYNGTNLVTTVTNKTSNVTGLVSLTKYTLGVIPNNGLRDGPKVTIDVTTRGVRFSIPTALTEEAKISLRYQEYSLGLVNLGTEPTGMFGGSHSTNVPAKVISSNNNTSVVEITSNLSSFVDGTMLIEQVDGVFAAFNGEKAIYFSK